MNEKLKRPGRKIAAEKRKLARSIIAQFSCTEEFYNLPGNIKASLRALCPEIVKLEESFNQGYEFRPYSSIN